MPTTDAALELCCDLIRCPSVTPEDANCQAMLAERLEAIGFRCEHLRFGEVDNLGAERGEGGPLFVFAGHTDVVPTGPESAWRSPPFEPTLTDGLLTGRGAADMKASLAAMAPRYGEVTAPIVILFGDRDGVLEAGDHTAPLAAKAPQAEIRILNGLGHMLPFAAADEVVDAARRMGALTSGS